MFDANNVMSGASILKKIAEREAKILIEEPRGAGAPQVRIDEDDVFTGQRRRPRKGERMDRFPFAAGRGSYAEGGAGPPLPKKATLGASTAS